MLTPKKNVVWGIDVSTKQVDFALLAEDGSWQCNATVLHGRKPDDPGKRFAEVQETVGRFASSLAAHHPPVYVMIELPTGRFPNPQLMMTAGVAAAAIACATRAPLDFCAVSTWKAEIGLGGNATKEAVKLWAENLGGVVASQDAADALGIAAYAGSCTDGWVAPRWVPPPSYL